MKGKLGFKLGFYGVLAFIFAALGMTIELVVLLGFVLIVEKDEKTARTVMSALMFYLVYYILKTAFTVLDPISWISWGADYDSGRYKISTVMDRIETIYNFVLRIVLYIVCIGGGMAAAADKEVNVPFASNYVNKIFGKVIEAAKNVVNNTAKAQANSSESVPKAQAPAAPKEPVLATEPAKMNKDAKKKFCSNCGTEIESGKFCPKCGTAVEE